MQRQSWLTERNLATFSTHLFLPGRLRFPCTQTHTHARTRGRSDSTLYHPPPLVHLKSPLSPLTPRLPRNDPDAPSLLTVQGVSGDLTSHGGMQGAFFTFLSRRASGGEAWRSATALSRTADYILRLKQAARGGGVVDAAGARRNAKKRVSACGGPCPHRRRRRRPRVTASSCGCCVLAARSCLTPGLS